jgi:hypothetical protein
VTAPDVKIANMFMDAIEATDLEATTVFKPAEINF